MNTTVQAPTEKAVIYNFCSLNSAAQEWLFKQILYFDIAANNLAQAVNGMVMSVRNELITRLIYNKNYQCQLADLFLDLTSEMEDLPRDSFDSLTPDSKQFILLWANLRIYATEELWAYSKGKFLSDVEDSLLIEVKQNFEGSSAEEIALYFNKIDQFESALPSLPNFLFSMEVS